MAYAFENQDDINRVIDAVRMMERQLQNPAIIRGRRVPRGQGSNAKVVNVTSTTKTNGYYPGTLQEYTDGSGWTDSDAVYVFSDDALDLRRYISVFVAMREEDDEASYPNKKETAIYAAFPGGYSGTQTIVTNVTCNAGTLSVTTKSFVWVSGSLVSVT